MIQIGEYIKIDGVIYKIKEYEYREEFVNPHILYFENCNYGFALEKLPKHSGDILDLIEIGDLVELTIFCDETEYGSSDPIGATWYINDEIMLRNIKQQIKAGYMELDGILTHEQINSHMYRVGDE